jgi:hypothetical protein
VSGARPGALGAPNIREAAVALLATAGFGDLGLLPISED